MSARDAARWLPRVALACMAVACDRGAPERSPCPAGHAADPAREARLIARLESTALGAALRPELAHVDGMCFGAGALDVVLTNPRQLLLDRDLPDDEAAARLGHLLAHVRDGLPFDEATLSGGAALDCDAVVSRALDREAVAHVIEVRLQRALGVEPTVHRFEIADEIARLDDPAAIARMRAYLAEHPTGAPGIDGLAAGYRERCERLR